MTKYYAVRVIVHRKVPEGLSRRSLVAGSHDNVVYDDLGIPSVNLGFWLARFEENAFVKVLRDDDEGICFDIRCPRTIHPRESMTWARQTAEKISSHGVNAVAAPEVE